MHDLKFVPLNAVKSDRKPKGYYDHILKALSSLGDFVAVEVRVPLADLKNTRQAIWNKYRDQFSNRYDRKSETLYISRRAK